MKNKVKILRPKPLPPHANVTLEDILLILEGRHDAQEYVERTFRGALATKYLHMAL